MLTTECMVIDPPFRERLGAARLDSVSRVLGCVGDQLAAWSRTSDAIRVELPDQSGAVYIKRYHYPRWRHRRRALFRGVFFGQHRARAEYRNLMRMRQSGVHAVRPIAWGERRFLHFVQSCFLITEAVPDAIALSAFVQTFASRPPTPPGPPLARGEWGGWRAGIRHEFLEALAAEIKRMHDAGFVHQDLFWRNVLVRPVQNDRFEFYFLDASVGRRVRLGWRKRERVVRDLAALSVLAPGFCSRADQLRFMLTYLATDALRPADRAWLRDVQRHWAEYRESETVRLRRGRVFEGVSVGPPKVDGFNVRQDTASHSAGK